MLDTDFKSKNLLNSYIYDIQKNSKPKLKIEYGKYYLLNTENYYFCPDLRRKIKFVGKVAIKCGSKFGDDGFFGELINTESEFGPDYQTNVEIEFGSDDVISEYELRDMPVFFIDFDQNKNKIIYNM